jgi:hypothetical protein
MPSGTLTTVEVDDRQPFVAPAETTATIRSLARSRTRVARTSAVRRYAAWSVNTDPPILTTVNTERSTLDVHCEGARVLRSGSLMPDARSFAFGRLEHRNCPNITRRCTRQRVEGRSQTAARARIGVQPSPIAAVTGGRRRGPAAPDAVARQQLGDVNGIRETNRRSQPHEPAAAARWLRVAALRRSRVASLAAFGKGFCNVIEERRGCRVRARARPLKKSGPTSGPRRQMPFVTPCRPARGCPASTRVGPTKTAGVARSAQSAHARGLIVPPKAAAWLRSSGVIDSMPDVSISVDDTRNPPK